MARGWATTISPRPICGLLLEVLSGASQHSLNDGNFNVLAAAANEKRNVVVTPRRIGSVSDLKMKSIAVGMKHTLLLTTDGLVYGMGKNRTGCLGTVFACSLLLGHMYSLSHFVLLPLLCLLQSAGLGKGHKKAVWDAVKIDALANVNIEFVGAGERHSVAVSDVGTIYAFGSGRAPSTSP